MDSNATNACTQLCRLKWLNCHTGHQGVSRYCTRGESVVLHADDKACKKANSCCFKIQAGITTRLKQCTRSPTKRTDVLQKLQKYSNIYTETISSDINVLCDFIADNSICIQCQQSIGQIYKRSSFKAMQQKRGLNKRTALYFRVFS